MMATIIEDCSPYFVRFAFPGAEKIIKICNDAGYVDTGKSFIPHRLDELSSERILDILPRSNELRINHERVSLFVSKPGLDYRAHKDGPDTKFSINIHVKVLDAGCVTSWYADEDLAHYSIDTHKGTSRECVGFDRTKHTPIKTMVAQQGECVLFNTNIFHGFYNESDNERIILTLRDYPLVKPRVTFDEARAILFGIPREIRTPDPLVRSQVL